MMNKNWIVSGRIRTLALVLIAAVVLIASGTAMTQILPGSPKPTDPIPLKINPPCSLSGQCSGSGLYCALDKTCKTCPTGYYCSSSTRTACPAGTCNGSQGSTASTACTKCAAGMYSMEGQASCTACPAGTFSGSTGQASCAACPTGTFGGSTGQASCTPCPPGTRNYKTGQTACELCPVAYYNDKSGQKDCFPCPQNTYNPLPGQTSCKACVGDTYADLHQTSCKPLKVTLWEDENYAGGKRELGWGEHTMNTTSGDFNDLTTSISCIPPGVEARFYADGNRGQGYNMIVLREAQCRPNVGATHAYFNDAISWVTVCKVNDTSCTRPIFWQDAGDKIRGFVVEAGTYNDITGGYPVPDAIRSWNGYCPCRSLGNTGSDVCQPNCPFNDSFSALDVPAGWKVTFCDVHFGGGACATVVGPGQWNLSNVNGQNFDDKISYIKAERVP